MNQLAPVLVWIATIIYIIFYPMLISIYVFLPLMIGLMGYLFIFGLENSKTSYIILSLIYLINLEVNLSLPLFLTILTVIFFYIFIYPTLAILKECKTCVALFSVLFIDLLYFIMLVGYDFVFDKSSIVVDKLILYTLVVDMVMVFLL
jgi:hypothetical protein